MNSRAVQTIRAEQEDTQPMQPEELAVFIEADALQFEMGNIVAMTVLASELAFASTNDTGFSGDIASCIEIHQSDNDSISSEIVIVYKMDAHDELLMRQCLQNVAAKLRGRKE